MESKGAVENGSRTLEDGHKGGIGGSSILAALTRMGDGRFQCILRPK